MEDNTVRSDYYGSWFRTSCILSKVHRLYTDYSTDWMGGGERGEGCHPSDLLCWLTVIWSGAPTDSLGGGPYLLLFVLKFMDDKNYKVEEKH